MIGMYFKALVSTISLFCIVYNLVFWKHDKLSHDQYTKIRNIILRLFGILFIVYIFCVVRDEETKNYILRNILAGVVLHYLLIVITFRVTIL